MSTNVWTTSGSEPFVVEETAEEIEDELALNKRRIYLTMEIGGYVTIAADHIVAFS